MKTTTQSRPRLSLYCTLLFACLVAMSGMTRGGEVSDTTPARLESLVFDPPSVDVSASAATVVFTAHITDGQSGFSQGYVRLKSPSGTLIYSWFQTRISGDANNGVYKVTATLPRYSEPGTWHLDVVMIWDGVRNLNRLWEEDLAEMGIATTLAVTGSTDLSPPAMVDLGVPADATDVSAGPQNVTFTLRVTDDLAGFDRGTLRVKSASGAQTQSGTLEFLSGDGNDGYYTVTISMPQYSENGTWQVDTVDLFDKAGRNRLYLLPQLLDLGFPTAFLVASVPTDTKGPQLAALSLDPITVDVTRNSACITFTARVTDDLSGFASGWITLSSPSGGQLQWAMLNIANNHDGNSLNGTFWPVACLQQLSEAGTWRVVVVYLYDTVGNARRYFDTELMQMGFPTKINVTQPSYEPDAVILPAATTTVTDSVNTSVKLTIPNNAVTLPTEVAIDVISSPIEVPIPTGLQGECTSYVNIHLDPEPAYPLSPPGLTVVLPLVKQMVAGSVLRLFRINADTGMLEEAIDVTGSPVVGSVDPGGFTATFSGISRLSTVVGLNLRGDVDGDGDVDKNDLALVTAARNKPATGPDDPRDLDGDGKITVLDGRILVTLFTRPGGAI